MRRDDAARPGEGTLMRRIAPLAIAAAAIAIAPPALAQQAVGVSTAVKNDVRIKRAGAPVAKPVQVKQRIALNDAVQTGVKSQLQVLLLDKSMFNVGANARLVIDRFVYDPNRGGRTLGATVTKGAFRFMSGKPDRGGNTQIRTPVASIGIRGTVIEGVVGESAGLIAQNEAAVGRKVRIDPESASLIILRGPGAKTQGNTLPGAISVTAGGRTVNLAQPMMAVFVPFPGAAPIGPFRISQRGLMQVQALLFPAVAQRLGLSGPADNLGGDPDGVYYPPGQQGPDYPYTPGGYPPGTYPPGTYPGGRYPPGGPNGGSTPPNSGPGGFGTPGFPPIQPPQPRPRPQGQRGGNSPAGGQGPANVQSPAPTPTPAPAPSPVVNNVAPSNNQGPARAVGSPQPSPTPMPTPTPTPPPGKGKPPN
jgi:hypothetical protein